VGTEIVAAALTDHPTAVLKITLDKLIIHGGILLETEHDITTG
jgi:hypothetical protein